jgi:hypothetical protein
VDDYYRKTMYGHQRSKERRAEKKEKPPNSVAILGVKHAAEESEQLRRHQAETRKLQAAHDNEVAHDMHHHGGRGRGDHAREKERVALMSKHQEERASLRARHAREMEPIRAKAAAEMD